MTLSSGRISTLASCSQKSGHRIKDHIRNVLIEFTLASGIKPLDHRRKDKQEASLRGFSHWRISIANMTCKVSQNQTLVKNGSADGRRAEQTQTSNGRRFLFLYVMTWKWFFQIVQD